MWRIASIALVATCACSSRTTSQARDADTGTRADVRMGDAYVVRPRISTLATDVTTGRMALSQDGTMLYYADPQRCGPFSMNLTSGVVKRIAGDSSCDDLSCECLRVTPVGGTTEAAKFGEVLHVALSGDGASLYVADGHQIYRVSGGRVEVFAGAGSPSPNQDGRPYDGPAVAARFDEINVLHVAKDGSVLVGENGFLRRVSSGVVSTLVGNLQAQPHIKEGGAREVNVGGVFDVIGDGDGLLLFTAGAVYRYAADRLALLTGPPGSDARSGELARFSGGGDYASRLEDGSVLAFRSVDKILFQISSDLTSATVIEQLQATSECNVADGHRPPAGFSNVGGMLALRNGDVVLVSGGTCNAPFRLRLYER